ncbi:zinc knuckle CX2CX4HX4C containing protein [Tanacetum coccineum]
MTCNITSLGSTDYSFDASIFGSTKSVGDLNTISLVATKELNTIIRDFDKRMQDYKFPVDVILGSIFGVSNTSLEEFNAFLEKSKTRVYDDVMFGMTSDEYNVAQEALKILLKKFSASGHVFSVNDYAASSDLIPNSDSPIVQSVVINPKPSSYAGAAVTSSTETKKADVKIQSMATSLEKGLLSWLSSTTKGLEDVLENGSWMIRNSPITLKKWTMNTSLLKEELTRIPMWLKLHDVSNSSLWKN